MGGKCCFKNYENLIRPCIEYCILGSIVETRKLEYNIEIEEQKKKTYQNNNKSKRWQLPGEI